MRSKARVIMAIARVWCVTNGTGGRHVPSAAEGTYSTGALSSAFPIPKFTPQYTFRGGRSSVR